MKVSIIIPVYNSEKYLNRCLDSVLNQDYKKIEIIIINDGSSDKSEEIINNYSKKDNRIININKNNSGVSDSRNIGIDIASGEYITFIDSDDWIEKSFISNMMKIIKNQKVDCVRTNYFINYSNEVEKMNVYSAEITNKILTRNEINSNILLKILNGRMQAYVWSILVKKEVIKDKIYFRKDLRMMEDTIFYLELLNNISTLYIDTNNTYHYFYNLDSTSHSSEKLEKNIDDVISVADIESNFIKENNLLINDISYMYFNLLMVDNMLFDLYKYDKLKFKRKYIKLINDKKFNEILNKSDFSKYKIYNKLALKLIIKRRYSLLVILYFFRKKVSLIKDKIFK